MSDIIVKFKPVGHKALINAIKELEKAQNGAGGATDKFKKSSNGALKTNRLLGGSFATMRSHLLLYNFAMGLGIKQVIQFAQQASKVQNMQKGFENLTGSTESAAAGMSKLRAATQGTVSDFNLLQQANNAMILGVTKNTDEMSEMFSLAKRLGDALGRDTASSVESLVTGIGRQSRLMLDNIGIIVKSEEAYENYANQLKKSKDELTDTEKKQAFMNAALDAAREKVDKLGPKTKQTSDQFAQFGATMTNIGIILGGQVAPVLGDFAEGISEFINDLLQSDYEELISDLQRVGVASQDLKDLNDAITLETALEDFEKNSNLIEDKFVMMSATISKKGAEAPLVLAETFKIMGAEINPITDGIIANFGEINNLESEKVLEGTKFLSQAMLEVGDSAATAVAENARLNIELKTNKNLSDKQIEGYNNIIARNKTQIIQNKDLVTAYRAQFNRLVEMLTAVVGYENAMKVLTGTTKDANDEDSKRTEIYKADIAALNEKAIIEQQQKLVAQELLNIRNAEFDTLEKKEKADKRANALLKQQMSLEEKLRKIKDKNIDANLKAANAIGNASKSIGQMVKADAQQMAAIEVVMSLINAYGAFLKTMNSKMMLTNPLATKVLAYSNLAAGVAASVVIAQQASKLGAGGSGGGGQVFGSFEQGGYVGGNRHSQGGTIIEAERGEFVMSRNAVESIGLETLNQMNQSGGGGSINVSVTGNVLTQDFVEGELAESIKEAVRRGSDFGIG